MTFSPDSLITLVITSCGRFDLLKRTLDTFDRYNTAAIREVLITEDSGDEKVRDCIPEHWKIHTRVWVNKPKLGQLRSIDMAYAEVKTPYIFHCEDDWAFYRPGFVEESLQLLEHEPQSLQVWLRSLAHDLAVHSPYIYAGPRQSFSGIPYYRLNSSKPEWQGFSFNPGLRRLADYLALAPYAEQGGEKKLSQHYAAKERYALILENDAVLHTGWGEHVAAPEELLKKAKRKAAQKWRLAFTFIFGLFLGLLLGIFL